MSKMKNPLKIGFLLLILCALAHTAFAEEVKTTNIDKPSTQQALQKPLTDVDKHSNQQFLHTPLTPEDIIKEAHGSVERAISILKIAAIFIEVLVALIAIILGIAGAFGFFEIRKWKILREDFKKETEAKINKIEEDTKDKIKEIEEAVKFARESRNNLEIEVNRAREEMKKFSSIGLTVEPTKEIKEKFDEFSRRLDPLELFGIPLKPEDYLYRGVDLHFKGRYNEELKAYDKAIELKPDYAGAWWGKGAALDRLGRHEEALKAFDKAIELKPDDADARYNRACVYSIKGEKGKALSNLKKAIELDKSYKEKVKKDEDFKKLWDDEDFKRLVS